MHWLKKNHRWRPLSRTFYQSSTILILLNKISDFEIFWNNFFNIFWNFFIDFFTEISNCELLFRQNMTYVDNSLTFHWSSVILWFFIDTISVFEIFLNNFFNIYWNFCYILRVSMLKDFWKYLVTAHRPLPMDQIRPFFSKCFLWGVDVS